MSPESSANTTTLTQRQQEIARFLCHTGFSYKEVAAHLDIAEGTMRKHTENIYRRIGVHSRAELTVALLQSNALAPSPSGVHLP